MTTETTMVEHRDATPRVGMGVETDACNYARRLLPDPTGWAPFRLESIMESAPAVACRVEVTGRTIQYAPYTSAPRVRCRVTFPGDGEPDETTGGWLYLGSGR